AKRHGNLHVDLDTPRLSGRLAHGIDRGRHGRVYANRLGDHPGADAWAPDRPGVGTLRNRRHDRGDRWNLLVWVDHRALWSRNGPAGDRDRDVCNRVGSPQDEPRPCQLLRGILVSDVIRWNNQFYILASSALAENRVEVLKHGETFAVFDRYGDI